MNHIFLGAGNFSIDSLIGGLLKVPGNGPGWGIAYSVDSSFQVYRSPRHCADDRRLQEYKGVKSPFVVLCSGTLFEIDRKGIELVFCSTAAERELYERIRNQNSSDLKTALRSAVEGFDGDVVCVLASPRCAAVAVRSKGREQRLNAVLESDHTVLSSAPLPGASYVNKRIGTVLPNGTCDFVSKLA